MKITATAICTALVVSFAAAAPQPVDSQRGLEARNQRGPAPGEPGPSDWKEREKKKQQEIAKAVKEGDEQQKADKKKAKQDGKDAKKKAKADAKDEKEYIEGTKPGVKGKKPVGKKPASKKPKCCSTGKKNQPGCHCM